MMGDSFSFHKRTDEFFKKRTQEATQTKAMVAFLIAAVLSSLVIILSEYDLQAEMIIGGVESSPLDMLGKITIYSFLISVFFLLPSIGLYWYLGKRLVGSKARISAVSYVWMLIVCIAMIVALVFLLGTIFPILSWLGIVLLILLLYFAVLSVKILHNSNYGQALLIIFLASGMGGAIILFINVIYFGYLFIPQEVYHDYYSTQNADGTLMAVYSYKYSDSGEARDICYVGFPEGWKEASGEITSEISRKLAKNVNEKKAFYKDDKEFLYFTYTLPIGVGFSECIKREEGEYWLEKGLDADYETYAVTPSTKSQNSVALCDSKILSKDGSVERHLVQGDFLGSHLGFSLVYQTTPGNSADLDEILSNIRCNSNS